MSHYGDIDVANIGTQLHVEHPPEQYFSVNFNFLKNDKNYNRDFFTINTIDHCL